MQVGNYSILIENNTTFVQISNQLYYYKGPDNTYVFSIEIFDDIQ